MSSESSACLPRLKEGAMTASDALLRIQELMDGVEWTPDTLQEIAEVLEQAGYRIRDTEE